MTDKQIFNTKEAADFLGLSEQTLHEYRGAGRGPKYSQPARKVYYFKEDLIDWVKNGNETWKPIGMIAKSIVEKVIDEN